MGADCRLGIVLLASVASFCESECSVAAPSIPSIKLEQEAQTFGLRERTFPCSGIGSPQHLQIREVISIPEPLPQQLTYMAQSLGKQEKLIPIINGW